MIISYKEELNIKLTLKEIDKLISKDIIQRIDKSPFFNDEPKFPLYVVKIKDIKRLTDGDNPDPTVSGLSVYDEKAKIKSIGEAVERFCLAIYKRKELKFGCFKDIPNAVNPNIFLGISNSDISNENFFWSKVKLLNNNKTYFIPSQLIYVPYVYKNEKIIQLSTSTGTACGTSLYFALYRALCELVERETFMIYYLNRLPPYKIKKKSLPEKINNVLDILKRYRLETHCFYLKSDIELPIFLTIIIDRTGHGPSVALGLKAGYDLEETLLGSIEEAQQSRPWLRSYVYRKGCNPRFPIKDILDRGLFWYPLKMIKKINFFLNTKRRTGLDEISSFNQKKLCVEKLLKQLKNKNIHIYFKDLTNVKLNGTVFKVVKVISPEIQPMYFDEEFKIFTKRIFEVPRYLGFPEKNISQLNNIPHPFL